MKKLNLKQVRNRTEFTVVDSLGPYILSDTIQEKLQKANETIARIGLPKELTPSGNQH